MGCSLHVALWRACKELVSCSGQLCSPASERTSRSYLTTRAMAVNKPVGEGIDALADFASLLLLLFTVAGSCTTCCRRCVRELSNETANEHLGEV